MTVCLLAFIVERFFFSSGRLILLSVSSTDARGFTCIYSSSIFFFCSDNCKVSARRFYAIGKILFRAIVRARGELSTWVIGRRFISPFLARLSSSVRFTQACKRERDRAPIPRLCPFTFALSHKRDRRRLPISISTRTRARLCIYVTHLYTFHFPSIYRNIYGN